MKKGSILESFKDKKFKYGGYATLMTAVVLAILIVVNLLVDQIPWKLDLTQNKLYSISEDTYKILDNLDQDIRIIGLYEAGKENKEVDEILKKYEARTKKVSVEYVDPVKNPTFAKQYDKEGNGLSTGSLIVISGNKFKVISPFDLYDYNYQTYRAESIAVEQRVTSAISYVTSEKNPVVYTLQGHDETALSVELKKRFENENYEVKELNLLTEDKIPEDIDLLMVISPKRDISEEEDKKIREYLTNQGRAVFLFDVLRDELTNFQSLLKSYGVAIQPSIIVEGDRNHHAGNPVWLVPNMESHDIISPLKSKDMMVIMPGAQGIETLDKKKRSIEVEPLLTTSSNSWGKKNLDAKTVDKETGDFEGPFDLAVAVTDKTYEDNKEKTTKIVVVGNATFTDGQFSAQVPGNGELLLNSLSWLQDKKDMISIRSKSLEYTRLNITGMQSLVWSGIVVIVIPVVIFLAGLMVWLRRRHL
ncbi:GldG family protein [Xylanivirga thermophila]|uniref:GldG family protein n=1 Tax=Xylanivirga thermophila TaxID=2496273 RepID=UPI001A91A072|nr:GldG family protein [Xylanivirga thermophila]